MNPPLRLLDPSYRLTLAYNDYPRVDDAQIGAQRRRRVTSTPVTSTPPVSTNPSVQLPDIQGVSQVSASHEPNTTVGRNPIPFDFHLSWDTPMWVQQVLTAPVYTDGSVRLGASYRVNQGLRPYLGVGVGDYTSTQTSGRFTLSGTRLQLEAGFSLPSSSIRIGSPSGFHINFLGGTRIASLGLDIYTTNQGIDSFTRFVVNNRVPDVQFHIPLGENWALQLGFDFFNPRTSMVLNDPSIPRCTATDGASCSVSSQVPTAYPMLGLAFNVSANLVSNLPLDVSPSARMQTREVFAHMFDLSTRAFSSLIHSRNIAILNGSFAGLGFLDSAGARELGSKLSLGQSIGVTDMALTYGRYAADLSLAIRRTEGTERGILIGSQATTQLVTALVCATSAPWPENLARASSGESTAWSDFTGRGACIQLPSALLGLGLGILDGYDQTGDPHSSRTQFWVTHGIGAAIGLGGLLGYWITRSQREVSGTPSNVAAINQANQEQDSAARWWGAAGVFLSWAGFSWMNRAHTLNLTVAPSSQGQGAVASMGGNFRGL